MKISDFGFEGVKLVEFDMYRDARGFFAECFNADEFARAGLPAKFAIDARSFNRPRVLRGLHFQYKPPQGKLVGVVRGRIYDVIVDLRRRSPTFGKYASTELSGDDGRFLWIPHGFAHGFCVLGDEPADVIYKLDAPYDPKGESGIRWSDPGLSINWPVANPIVSPRDEKLPTFDELKTRLGNFLSD